MKDEGKKEKKESERRLFEQTSLFSLSLTRRGARRRKVTAATGKAESVMPQFCTQTEVLVRRVRQKRATGK